MTNPATLRALAHRVEALTEHDSGVDAAIGYAIHPARETNPLYTGSIDAAVSLIPNGVEWDVSTIYNIARATVGLNTDCQSHGENKSCLPAPAITAAALRARAAEMEG